MISMADSLRGLVPGGIARAMRSTPQRSRQGRAKRAREHGVRRAQALTARTACYARLHTQPALFRSSSFSAAFFVIVVSRSLDRE
jgi:hypothetical protein